MYLHSISVVKTLVIMASALENKYLQVMAEIVLISHFQETEVAHFYKSPWYV